MNLRFIEIKKGGGNDYFIFDRNHLLEGKYKGIKIPQGGTIKNGNLIGFIPNKKHRLQLKKIGKVRYSRDNFQKLKGGGENSSKITLKKAINQLREYYTHNILDYDTIN